MTAVAEYSVRAEVQSFLRNAKKLLIDGDWVDAASGRTFPTYDPATGERIAEVAHGEQEDIDRAVRAARRAFDRSGSQGRSVGSIRGSDLADSGGHELDDPRRP